MVPEWEQALDKFLLPYKNKKYVIGAVLAGSRAAKTDSPRSDIDVHIVLSNSTKWRERGNKIIDGFLIEYFMNPLRQLREYQELDFKSGCRTDARMFSTGRVLFDKTGDIQKLQRIAKRNFNKEFKKIDSSSIELGKYFLWDELDNLLDLHESKSPLYEMAHSILLHKVLDTYRRYIRAEITTVSKLYRFFTEPEFCKRYRIKPFPDKIFVKYFLDSLQQRQPKKLERLIAYVHKQMGGLAIDGWCLRGKLTYSSLKG